MTARGGARAADRHAGVAGDDGRQPGARERGVGGVRRGLPGLDATATVEPGYALTGGGGDVHWSGAGNLLWRLEPSAWGPGFTAASKDHLWSSPASITAYAMGMRIV